MIRPSRLLIFSLLLVLFAACSSKEPAVLVFSKTTGYRHESIQAGKLALIELGKAKGFQVDTTEDATLFTEERLSRYRAVVFLNTTQDVLDPVQQGAFKRFIEAGGGFVGVHAAADTEYEWPWYGRLVGAYFKSHPEIQEAKLAKSGEFPNYQVKETWTRRDEWYNFKKISPDIKVIYSIDETSYKGGENGPSHPIAWYHEFEGGRSFYTALGHTAESYTEPDFLDHLNAGIQWAIGAAAPDFAKAKSKPVVEDNRFTKVVLDFNLDEPTEMAALPDGKILFVERKGAVKLYDPNLNKTTTVNKLNVGTKFEDGIIGLTLDPGFAENHFVYVFYSHPVRSANVISRFSFAGNKLDTLSEKEILEVVTQRETCCHTGGSMAFGPDGNLYISTGDNTSPFESDGYSPSDEGKGRSPFDAQKSSANTNDLRGKVLRIKVMPDGTYQIPDGNLFPKGEAKTRPEIYTMGTRNPYRISIDSKTGFLYWGEVGPDAGDNDSIRGPRGYDEVNQAKGPGFFGWPYFVGNNYAYAHYDFTNKKALGKWNPSAPINSSPNNTGKSELPPATPAFIYYPYANSEEFPMVRTGSRNAMAGPIYYSEKYAGVKTAFPDYFDGKLMIYDWMRNWIFLVTLGPQGEIRDIEPFLADKKFNNIIDMTYGPDGRLYMLEYGTGWFSQNIDARLVRIDYNGGNRPPVAQLQADVTYGSVPLRVKFTSKGTVDYDQDKLSYVLTVEDKTYKSENGEFEVTFTKPGEFDAVLMVTDPQGANATATVRVIPGNTPPTLSIDILSGNKTFFLPGKEVRYKVTATDVEDGSGLDLARVNVTFNHLDGLDMTQVAQGHQKAPVEIPGKALVEKSDCLACHKADTKSAGPSFKDIALKYATQRGARDMLAAKIIRGGAGVWGTTEMAAHPQISVEDARKMVDYIATFGKESATKTYPTEGAIIPGNEPGGVYILSASYEDKGNQAASPLKGSAQFIFRSLQLKANEAVKLKHARVMANGENLALDNLIDGAEAAFEKLDLTGIRQGVFTFFIQAGTNPGGKLEVHLDKPDGKLLGTLMVNKPGLTQLPLPINETGEHTLYLVFRNLDAPTKSMFYFGGIQFKP